MLTMSELGKYYLYRHIRLDKYEPFYIGIGATKKDPKRATHKGTYARAYSTSDRSNLWKKIAKKSDYIVEIMLHSDDYDFIKKKEIEFIAYYGRKNKKEGPLANLTDGGEGTLGLSPSELHRKKSSERMYKILEQKRLNPKGLKVINTITKEIFPTIGLAFKDSKITCERYFYRMLKGQQPNKTNYMRLDKYEEVQNV